MLKMALFTKLSVNFLAFSPQPLCLRRNAVHGWKAEKTALLEHTRTCGSTAMMRDYREFIAKKQPELPSFPRSPAAAGRSKHDTSFVMFW